MEQVKHRGDVWIAELDGDQKTRPVLLVSREQAYAQRSNVTVALITTRTRSIPTHVQVEHAGIPGLAGMVNCDFLRTVKQSALVEFLGQLPAPIMRDVDEALAFSLELPAK